MSPRALRLIDDRRLRISGTSPPAGGLTERSGAGSGQYDGRSTCANADTGTISAASHTNPVASLLTAGKLPSDGEIHAGDNQVVRIPAVAAACVALAACGEGERAEPPARPPEPAPAETGARAVRVVRTWAGSLRRGDVARSAAMFGLPALVQNGGERLRLTRRRDVVEWLESLPCGARLVRSQVDGDYLVATFRLTHRPGMRCDGPGGLAATAFLIRRGKIVEWRRVAVPAQPQPV